MASSTPRGDVRVVIIEDHVSYAEALELALTGQGYDVRVADVPATTATPAASASLVSSILRLRPKVVLLDLDLGPFGDGAPLVAPLSREDVQVVVITGHTDRARWGEALALGARVVLSKAQPLEDLLAVVDRIDQGLPVLEPADRDALVAAWLERSNQDGEVRDRIELLSAREREVLGELMRGHPVREIAARGVVSEATVRTQVKSILAKLEVSSQLAAVGLAHRVGWRPPDRVRS